jgi:hypothetical protein
MPVFSLLLRDAREQFAAIWAMRRRCCVGLLDKSESSLVVGENYTRVEGCGNTRKTA